MNKATVIITVIAVTVLIMLAARLINTLNSSVNNGGYNNINRYGERNVTVRNLTSPVTK